MRTLIIAALLVVLVGCSAPIGTELADPTSADRTPPPSAFDHDVARAACEELGQRYHRPSRECYGDVASAGPSAAPSAIDLGPPSIGLAEITMAGDWAGVTFEPARGGPPRWIASHPSGARVTVTGLESDDPEFHFLQSISFEMPMRSESIEQSGDFLQSFLFAADLAADFEARDWFLEAMGEWGASGDFQASRELTIDNGALGSTDVQMSIEASELAELVTLRVEVAD